MVSKKRYSSSTYFIRVLKRSAKLLHDDRVGHGKQTVSVGTADPAIEEREGAHQPISAGVAVSGLVPSAWQQVFNPLSDAI